jgi:hypothetical protein
MAISKKRFGTQSSAQDNFLEPNAVTISGATMVSGRPYGNGAITLTYSLPAASPPATLYTFTSTPATTTQTSTNNSTYTFTGLSGGTSYTITITPSNAAGNGASTTSSSVAIVTVPQAPSAPTATAQVNQDSVSWSAPANNGGSAITGYTLKSSDGPTYNYNASTTSATISETGGTSQTYQVLATNAQGNSSYSASSNQVTTQSPFFPFFPPFFPYFPPFFPFFPYFPPFFPYFPPFFPFFPYFPPFFPFFPYFPPFFPYFPYFPPFFPYFPYFPPFFPYFPYFPPFFPYFPFFPGFGPKVPAYKCVSVDTEVLAKDGWKKVENLQVGDKLITIHPEDFNYETQSANISSSQVKFVETTITSIEYSEKMTYQLNDSESKYSGQQPIFIKDGDIFLATTVDTVQEGSIMLKVDSDGNVSEIELKSIKEMSETKVADIKTAEYGWLISKDNVLMF